MKDTLIISGKQKAGKTSLTNAVIKSLKENDYEVRVFKFAGPIYEIQNAARPALEKFGLWPEGSEKDGDFLQVVGTEYGRRKRGSDVWVKIAREEIDLWLCRAIESVPKRLALIDDCRFENEFDAFDDAFKVRLTCPRDIRKARPGYWREDENHASEVGLDDYQNAGKFDFSIDTNTNSLEDARSKVLKEWGRANL